MGSLDKAAKASAFERLHCLNVRQEVLEKVFDSVPQRRRRGGAAGAGAFHLEIDDSLAVAFEDDVAAVASHRRADARLDQFLDRFDLLGVLGVEELAGRDESALPVSINGAPER